MSFKIRGKPNAIPVQAVKAMRFEGADTRFESADRFRERAIRDEELAKQIQEEEGDDF